MTLYFTLSVEDLVAFHLHVVSGRMKLFVRSAVYVFILMSFGIFFVTGRESLFAAVAVGLFTGLVYFAIQPTLDRRRLRAHFLRTFRSTGNESLHGRRELSTAQNGLIVRG